MTQPYHGGSPTPQQDPAQLTMKIWLSGTPIIQVEIPAEHFQYYAPDPLYRDTYYRRADAPSGSEPRFPWKWVVK